MWPGDVWHLWPGTYRHLWLALVIVVGLYAWDAKRSLPAPTDLNLALEVAALVVVNVLPASTHSLAVVAAAPFILEPLSSAAAYGRVAPWLRLLLGTPGLVATAVLHVSFLGILADRHRRAALDAARRGSWRPVPAWVTRAIALARAAHVACFGAIAVVLLGEFRAGRPTASPGVPAYAGAYYVMHLLSSMVMSSAALSDRNARHTSIALLLAPSRYVNWALQVREAVFAAPHGFPLFGVAMGCEAVRVAHGMLYALVGHRAWRRHVALDANFVPFCTALAESAVFFVSVANREPLLKVRWARAPQLVQGLLLGVERAVAGGRGSNGRPKPRSPSVDDDATARADEPWVPATARTMKVRVYRYDAAGDDAYVDMAVAPGKWTVSGYVEAKIADAPLDVRIKGAMRELARVDGSAILGVERCVAKAYTRDTKEWLWEHQKVGDAVYFRDVYVHERTAALARDFNGAAAAAGVAARVDVGAAAVVEIISVAGDGDAAFALGSDRRYVHVEPFIDGAYERFNKYNSNTFNALLLLSDRHAETISGAFSHFTYERSKRELVVCDIQGVRTASDTLTITDPQIHTCRSCDDFGAGNGQSLDHIRAFFASHECKGCCRALGLAHPYPEDLATGITKVHRSFSWSPFFLRKNYFAAGLLQSLLFAGPSTTPAAGKGD